MTAQLTPIMSFVRGELPLPDLVDHLRTQGVSLTIESRRLEISNPNQVTEVVGLADIATGFVNLLEDRDRLYEWARMILCADFVDLSEEFDNAKDGDLLLNALWDAMAGYAPEGRALFSIFHLANHQP